MKKEVLVRRVHPGHPWIFSNEVFRAFGDPSPGDVVEAFKKDGRKKESLGFAFYNPHSLIALRVFSKQSEFTPDFLRERLSSALAYRKSTLSDQSFRLVHGESDDLPGLVIDKYENGFVIQVNCLGMEKKKEMIVQGLNDVCRAQFVYEKSETTYRRLEGLEPTVGLRSGNLPDEAKISQDGLDFLVDIKEGQKTGFYFDQRDNRRRVRSLASGKKVLDLFCYTGGFALYAAGGGAARVLGIDSSARAIELARTNARLNHFDAQCSFETADVFEFLRQKKRTEEKFDIIILDPPAFTKSRKDLRNASRGYKDINLLAMRLLAPRGILVTASCSHHVFWNDFMSIINSAQADAGRRFMVLDRGTQAVDHPVLVGMPESEYLKCYFLQSLS